MLERIRSDWHSADPNGKQLQVGIQLSLVALIVCCFFLNVIKH